MFLSISLNSQSFKRKWPYNPVTTVLLYTQPGFSRRTLLPRAFLHSKLIQPDFIVKIWKSIGCREGLHVHLSAKFDQERTERENSCLDTTCGLRNISPLRQLYPIMRLLRAQGLPWCRSRAISNIKAYHDPRCVGALRTALVDF